MNEERDSAINELEGMNRLLHRLHSMIAHLGKADPVEIKAVSVNNATNCAISTVTLSNRPLSGPVPKSKERCVLVRDAIRDGFENAAVILDKAIDERIAAMLGEAAANKKE